MQQVERWTCDSKSRVQILLEATLRNNLGQVVRTYVPLSPSSITWYRPKGVTAAYRRVDDLRSPAGWLPVHRDQLRAQRSVSSMRKPLAFTNNSLNISRPNVFRILQRGSPKLPNPFCKCRISLICPLDATFKYEFLNFSVSELVKWARERPAITPINNI